MPAAISKFQKFFSSFARHNFYNFKTAQSTFSLGEISKLKHEESKLAIHRISVIQTYNPRFMPKNKLNVSNWTNIDDCEGLLFFGQLVDELLFDYTLDSYKPMALNTKSLILECLHTIEEIRRGSIKERNLQSVVEELKWSLERDLAIKEILKEQFPYYHKSFQPNNLIIDDLYNLCTLVLNSLKGTRYYESLKKILVNEVNGKARKVIIRQVTNSLITELVNFGYHPSYIYAQNRYLFFSTNRKEKIESNENIDYFFDLFTFKEKEFIVVFLGKFIFRSFRDSLNGFNIVVTANYRPFSRMQGDLQFSRSRKRDESFVICSKIMAFDHFSAREKAEGLVGRIANIFNFYHHKEKPALLEKAVVSRTEDNYVRIINKPVRSILKVTGDMIPVNAASAVKKILPLDLEKNTMYRFARTLDLHSAALAATAIENQLLDLWAALETLLPKKIHSGKDRIVQISEVLVDAIQLHYLVKLIRDLEKSLLNWDREKTQEILSSMPDLEGATSFQKVAALVMIESNKPHREQFYESLKYQPLLKNKLYEMFKQFGTPKALKKRISDHTTKLNWHLRRIYRTRGFIIHSGQVPRYTAALVENLHGYLDIFLKQFISTAQKEGVKSIEEGILKVGMKVRYRDDIIDEATDKFEVPTVLKVFSL
jgi:hypothetical protein